VVVLGLVACGTAAEPASPGPTSSPAAEPATSEPTTVPLPTASPTPTPTATQLLGLALLPTGVPRAQPAPTVARNTTPRPTATPNAARLDAERLSTEAMEYLTNFIDEYSTRASGSPEELVAAEFLKDEMAAMGYKAVLQDFTIELLSREFPFLTVPESDTTPEELEIRAQPMSNSSLGDVTAPLVFVQMAFEEDIEGVDLTGSIALIERGLITFQEKVSRVSEAGAVGAIVFNNTPGGFAGALSELSAIPAISITQEDGLDLLARLDSREEVPANIRVQHDSMPSQNVVAEKAGTAGKGVVILGAHYDTVEDTQAANDNSTGVTSLILMAKELQDTEFPYTLRFVFFGVEEIGLFGSRHYVSSLSEAERSDIIAMLNFDSLGAGEASVLGGTELVSMATKYSSDNGLFISISPGLTGGSSDHTPFVAVDIPAIFFFGDDFSRINSPRDTLAFVDPDIMGRQMVLGMGLLDLLAEAEE